MTPYFPQLTNRDNFQKHSMQQCNTPHQYSYCGFLFTENKSCRFFASGLYGPTGGDVSKTQQQLPVTYLGVTTKTVEKEPTRNIHNYPYNVL